MSPKSTFKNFDIRNYILSILFVFTGYLLSHIFNNYQKRFNDLETKLNLLEIEVLQINNLLKNCNLLISPNLLTSE